MPRKWFLIAGGLAVLVVLGVIAWQAMAPGNSAASPDKQAAAVPELFGQRCAVCHGTNREGRVGPALTSIGNRRSRAEISAIIMTGKVDGRQAMPTDMADKKHADEVANWLVSTSDGRGSPAPKPR